MYNNFEGVLAFGQQQLVNPLTLLGYSILEFVVGLILAGVIILLGYAVAWAVHWVVKKGLDQAKIDKWLQKNHLDKSIGYTSVSELGASLLKWYIFLIFLVPAVGYLALGEFASLLADIVRWLPHVIVAIAIMMFGLILADFVADKMSKAKGPAVKHLNNITRVLIIVFVGVVALQEVGIYLRLAESTFLVLLTGLTLALSLALGIGFGLGAKDQAAQIVKQWKKKF
ncbi:hypothetical protein HZA99_06465 [Candidatus Woesearchaeota archaeon]|nr:hypothetical protein [Candidatus Woesearchaeota archaeon]